MGGKGPYLVFYGKEDLIPCGPNRYNKLPINFFAIVPDKTSSRCFFSSVDGPFSITVNTISNWFHSKKPEYVTIPINLRESETKTKKIKNNAF